MQLLWDRNAFMYVIQLGLEPLRSSRGDGFGVLNSTPLWFCLYGIAYTLFKGIKAFFVCVVFKDVSSVGSFNHLTRVALLELIYLWEASLKSHCKEITGLLSRSQTDVIGHSYATINRDNRAGNN